MLWRYSDSNVSMGLLVLNFMCFSFLSFLLLFSSSPFSFCLLSLFLQFFCLPFNVFFWGTFLVPCCGLLRPCTQFRLPIIKKRKINIASLSNDSNTLWCLRYDKHLNSEANQLAAGNFAKETVVPKACLNGFNNWFNMHSALCWTKH